MAGNADVGGNRSVEWSIEADKVEWAANLAKMKGGYRQSGVDKGPGSPPGNKFRISIRPPKGWTAVRFLKTLRDPDPPPNLSKGMGIVDDRVVFTLRIERETPDQIRISWPADLNAIQRKVKRAKRLSRKP